MNQEHDLIQNSTEPLPWSSTEDPTERCRNWLLKEKISFRYENSIFFIDDKTYYFYDEYVLLGKDEDTEEYVFDCKKQDTDYIFFFFGSKLYYSPWSKVELNEAECLGQPLATSGTFLGLHGKNEVLRGLSPYDRWAKRLKFYGFDNVGLCERNTLAGTLEFQASCKKHGLNFIFGYELELEGHCIKLYVVDEIGWENLLTIHYHNVVAGDLNRKILGQHKHGLLCVISKTFTSWGSDIEEFLFKTFYGNIYFQFSFREYKTRSIDDMYMTNLATYLESGGPDFIPPVMVDDCYYPKADDYEAWCLLLAQSHNFFNQSDDLYIKTDQEIVEQFRILNPTTWYEKVLVDAIANREHLKSSFEIKSSGPKLPVYIPTEEEKILGTNQDIFYHYVYSGLGKIKVSDIKEYETRLDEELDVMEKGNLIDYFLILKDCYNYADKVGIRYNFGRGSAAGSLALYCMGLTKIDPLKEKLIFARFLNEARITGSLPDVDIDMESGRRDEIKQYLINKYGQLHTCYIGAKTEYKVKSSIGDIAKFIGLSNTTKNLITENLPSGEHEIKSITKLAHFCIDKNVTREWVEKYPRLFELIAPIVETVRSNSVHAAGVVVFPNDKPNYLYCPMKIKDGTLISEWDGAELDKMGFLKNDILSIDQLDKIGNILKLIGKDIDIYSIPVDDEKTLELFNKGLTQDVFQFNSSGMTELLKMIGIKSIKDLDAAVALHRPGAMGTGGHTAYANRKNGREEFSFIPGTENQTKDTYGVMLYQEQLIFIAQEVGGFTLSEGDLVRKFTGKKDLKGMQELEPKFIDGGLKKGYKKEDLEKIWQVFIDSSSYSFNKSHSVCYARLGYVSMWFKAHYPNEFFQTSLQFVETKSLKREETKAAILKEMEYFGIANYPVSINYSTADYSVKNGKLYSSLTSVKQMGESAIKAIIEERDVNGKFFSYEDFEARVKIPKNKVKNLIIAGAFNEFLNTPLLKYAVVKNLVTEKEAPVFERNKMSKFFWSAKQMEVSGFTDFDFAADYARTKRVRLLPTGWETKTMSERYFDVVGIISEITKYKTGSIKIMVRNKNQDFPIVVSKKNHQWAIDRFVDMKGVPVCINCMIMVDDERKKNALLFIGDNIIEL